MYKRSLILLMISFLIMQCGKDLNKEGEKAFAEGNYTQAIKFLTDAQLEDSANHDYDETIFWAYLYRGEELFRKTRNVKAFGGNFEQAIKYYPKNTTKEFKRKYSQMLLSLANAYVSTRPSDETEREFFFENAVDKVKLAIEVDSTNSAADSMLAKLKDDHFQNLVDKGKSLYKKAGRNGNADLYFTAEYYFKEAQKFEPENSEIQNYLSKITKMTLPVLNYREGVSLAVAGFDRERKAILMTLSIKNYTAKPLSLNLQNFKLVDSDGNRYSVNEDEMKKHELLGETCITNMTLNSENPDATGLIAFDAPKDVNIAYVYYQINGNNSARKYFY